MRLRAASVGGGPAGASPSDGQINPSLGRDHREQCGVVVSPVDVQQQLHAQPDDGLQETQGLRRLVRIADAVPNPPFRTGPWTKPSASS